ncbi:hypothetical protein EW146_g9188 [Bondarzewia mesenterica]|uniref:AB hydrolase-1 domain-containing protein n=1 Tax=Bondarzewia mesenterica TaxID=1095465 RepID=A0A4S4LDV2_9AGAM|nr:hypothetical protein EW146_g9188 [Bondarzewia mesenterica]
MSALPFLIVAAIAVHGFFNRFEPRGATTILFLVFATPAVLSFLLYLSSLSAFSLSNFLISYAVFWFFLLFSLAFYRLSPFHPLAKYPGPVLFKLTRFAAWYLVRTGSQHRYYQALHNRYGLYIRTGPNHLHISDAAAISAVLGSREFTKGGRYNAIRRPGSQGSLLSLTDPHEHTQRRRIWDRALNAAALKGYQDALTNRVSQFVSSLEQRADEGSLDLSQWLSLFSFDFMGDLAYGGVFNLMEQGGDEKDFISIVSAGVQQQELAGAIPWIRPFYDLFPNSANDLRFIQFAKETVLKRQAKGTAVRDLFSYLLDEDGAGRVHLLFPTLVQEASFALVAGSDTSGTTLANLFYYLLSDPPTYRRLQAEIDEAASDTSLDVVVLANLPYLNAVITETLRLQPVVPNGVQRVLSPQSEGIIISGKFIPPSTTVQVSTYIIHRDPAHFSPAPELFSPERWLMHEAGTGQGTLTEDPQFRLNRAAYFPWSYGSTSCAGKNLALMEMRVVTAAFVRHFDARFAPEWNWTPSDWEKNLRDSYVLLKGRMPVFLHPLRYIATRFSQPSHTVPCSDATPFSVLIAPGVGFTSDLWIPVIKHLYRLQGQPNSPIRILSVWVVDRPNHGDAALLNEDALKRHHSEVFNVEDYGAAITSFIDSGTLSQDERASLVALGHSGGTGSIVIGLTDKKPIPYQALVLVEPPFLNPEAYPIFQELGKRVRAFNYSRPASWNSLDLAMEYIMNFPPWRNFDAEILHIMRETFFHYLTEQSGSVENGAVTMKTPFQQQTASFMDIEGAFAASERLISILHGVPTHVINGAYRDLWPGPMYDMIAKKLEEHRSALASVTVIDETGHYAPHEKPEELAIAAFRAIGSTPSNRKSKL